MPKPDVHDDNYVRFTKEDADFITAAPTIIRDLVERVRKLESDLAQERKVRAVSYHQEYPDRLVGGRNPFTPGFTKEST